MCGITGIYAFNELGRMNMINLQQATDVLEKRGPDDQDTFISERVGLGHRRLSILDLSKNGRQPMQDKSGRYILVFNGEIYNYRSLRQDLSAKGVSFQSETDTEVLLYLLIHEGIDALEKLNGFFAFALLDKEENSLLVARDRYGIKPLLFYYDEDKFLFASEMKSLMAYGIKKELDYLSLFQFLQLNYLAAPHTMLKRVEKILPGHYLMVKGKKIDIKRYYKTPFHEQPPLENKTYPDLIQALRKTLDQSVKDRLVADVPLGTFLSGGIDSSVVSALASKHVTHLQTFSIGYADEPFYDETEFARAVSKKIRSKHHIFLLTNKDLFENLFEMLDYCDEPFADSSALAVYILSKKTKNHVTVSLSGDGADELFSGYVKHSALERSARNSLTNQVIKRNAKLWEKLPKSRDAYWPNKVRQLHRFSEGLNLGPKERYYRWAALASEKEAFATLHEGVQKQVNHDYYAKRKARILKHIHGKNYLREVLYTDQQLVLPNDMLTKVDLMSMAHGLEIRVPFLDHRVVDFVQQLPDSAKMKGGMRKRILQDAFRGMLPPSLYKRSKKGFEVPLLKWMRHELRDAIENDWLDDDFIHDQGIFSTDATKALKKQLFSSNPGDAHARVWALITFQYWWKKYLD